MTTVLLVEDNDMNRDMMIMRLTKRGFTVESAADGNEAVEKAIRICPDIILMDMSLPKMDGLTATRMVKSNPASEKIPVIVLTANATVFDRDNALAAGCDDFETKPVNFSQLIEKMNYCLEHAGRRDG